MKTKVIVLIAASAVLLIAIAVTVFATDRREPGDLVGPQEAYRMVREGKAILVDVRDRASYEAGHLAGALLVPLHLVGENADRLAGHKLTLITYCSCPAEETSTAAAMELMRRGVDDVLVLRGGIRGWIAADLPLRVGSRP